MNIVMLSSAIEAGLIFGIMSLGVYITFRILDFPDLTTDGSFTLGAALSATFSLKGYGLLFSLLGGFLGGAFAGFFTAFLTVRFKIFGILSSIIVCLALYSINLRIMGCPNLSLGDLEEINSLINFTGEYQTFVFNGIIAGGILIILYFFLTTSLGLSLRSSGQNEAMSQNYGINTSYMKYLGLMLGNGLIALAGGLFSHLQGSADINMGNGIIILGLVSCIIGEALIKTRKIFWTLFSVMIGSILYRVIVSLALNTDFESDIFSILPSDLNLITAIVVVMFLLVPKLKKSAV